MKKLTLMCIFLSLSIVALAAPPAPYGPVPSEPQMRWHENEMMGLIHYGLNTYTDKEWGYGDVDPKAFNPSNLDTDQWVLAARAGGLKGLVLVAKHHDGFCLWPSKLTEYSVAASPWKGGKGDVVGDLAKSCKKYGMGFGVYLSPWDRNHAEYGRPAYIEYYYKQLEELLTSYGDNLFEFWIDGANGGDGYYGGARETRRIDRQAYYRYDKIFALVKRLQPGAVIFSDVGPGVRWVGNERAIAGETNWCRIDTRGFFPGTSDPEYNKALGTGMASGKQWIPAEANTPIRPGWFYHAYHQPKSLELLLDTYYKSVGRNATFDMGLIIGTDGQIPPRDVARLKELGDRIRQEYAIDLTKGASIDADNTRADFPASHALDQDKTTYWATNDGVQKATVTLHFAAPKTFNRLMLQEYIRLGQRVKSFNAQIWKDGAFQDLLTGTTIGYKRLLRFDTVTTGKLRITLETDAPCLTLSRVGVFNAPPFLRTPIITRKSDGTVELSAEEGRIFVALGDAEFKPYASPLALEKGGRLRAYVQDKATGAKSETAEKLLGMMKTNWIAKSPSGQNREIVIDLGKNFTLTGFTYLPRRDRKRDELMETYTLFVSRDGKMWGKPSAEGRLSNIRNSPNERLVRFEKNKKGRYVKILSKSTAQKDVSVDISEIEILVK